MLVVKKWGGVLREKWQPATTTTANVWTVLPSSSGAGTGSAKSVKTRAPNQQTMVHAAAPESRVSSNSARDHLTKKTISRGSVDFKAMAFNQIY
jgi:hypothetical protein